MINKTKQRKVVAIASAMALAIFTAIPAFADLPGMPMAAPAQVQPSAAGTPAKPEAVANKGVRPNDERPVEVALPTPVRGSLFAQGAAASAVVNASSPEGSPITSAVNLIAVAPTQPRRYHKNDIVTVIVREDSDSETTGQGNSKKTQDFDLAIKQFLQLALQVAWYCCKPQLMPLHAHKIGNNQRQAFDVDSLSTILVLPFHGCIFVGLGLPIGHH